MSKIRVLVVEDEPIVAEDIANRLERMGYEVVDVVESGEAAIATAATTTPDLALMDIVLEGEMDGIQAAEHLRKNYGIPIVYLTANADETTLQRAKATIPFGYILKPFKEKELKVTIEIAISRHQADLEVQHALQKVQALSVPQDPLQEVEASSSHSQYLVMAVHELRTPLSIVKVSASLLRERGDHMAAPERNRNLAYIENAVSSMNDLLEDVLMFSKFNHTCATLAPEPIDIKEFCESLITALSWSLGDQYIVNFSAKGDCRYIEADPKLLWHLINNLLSNAVKYSPQASTVGLEVECGDRTVTIRVIDQGIGIPIEDQDCLFEPFHRARNVGSIAGTGLGLAIVKHCVDLHGGQISFVSTPGEGTTFTITLPR